MATNNNEVSEKSKYYAIKFDFERNKVPLSNEKKKIYDAGKEKGW